MATHGDELREGAPLQIASILELGRLAK